MWKESIQEKKRNHQFSVQSAMIIFIFYLNVTGPLIIPLVFIFLPCRENAHDNN